MKTRSRPLLAALAALALAGPALAQDYVGAFVPETSSVVLSLDNQTSGSRRSFYFGESHALASAFRPVAGDFDGDGKDSLAEYSTREGIFYVANTNVPGVIDYTVAFGVSEPAGVLWPVAGDWDGDGDDDLGLFDAGDNTWYLDGASSFQWGWPDVAAIPLAGDWDGDGDDSPGLYNPLLHKFAFTQTAPPSGEPTLITYGTGSDVHPVVGDWDGDGDDSAGYYDLSAETFHLRNDSTGGDLTTVTLAELLPEFAYAESGLPGIYPVAGDWDTSPSLPADTLYDWTTATPASVGLSQSVLNAAAATGATSNYSHLHSLLVARHGKLAFEQYYRGYDATTTNNIKSVSKSFLSALYGIAIEAGDFPNANKSNPLPSLMGISMQSWLSEYSFSSSIKLWHMLTMSAGLAWQENPFPSGFIPSNDWPGFVVESSFNSSQLGTVWKYSSGLTHCGSEILTRATGDETKDFAEATLFADLGISATRWDHEPRNNVIPTATERELYMGGWQVYMRPRDMAGFGQLYLDDGEYDDGSGAVQVVPEIWVDQTTTSAGVVSYYGAWWRTETFCQSSYPYHCAAGFNALGYGGQHIFVFPTLDLVVVMTSTWNVTGGTSGSQISKNTTLLKDVLNAVVGD